MPVRELDRPPIATQRIVVLRHGERRDAAPDAPSEGDPPLTQQGRRDIVRVAQKLRQLLGAEAIRRVALVVSPFARCVQTAEGLREHGVGIDGPLVYDCSLCEVYGPARIKVPRAPALPRYMMEVSIGAMPQWGESIADAHARFVESLRTNSDRFTAVADVLSDSASAAEEVMADLDSLTLPAAVTNRSSGGAGAWRHPTETLDVVLVTHGDALSAVISHFYPARTVYEADFLSFVVMRRYGLRNRVFHVDDSVGVNWIVEGPDPEPEDPAYTRAQRSPSPSGSETDPDDFLDDEDEEAFGGGGVPKSSINRRYSHAKGGRGSRAPCGVVRDAPLLTQHAPLPAPPALTDTAVLRSLPPQRVDHAPAGHRAAVAPVAHVSKDPGVSTAALASPTTPHTNRWGSSDEGGGVATVTPPRGLPLRRLGPYVARLLSSSGSEGSQRSPTGEPPPPPGPPPPPRRGSLVSVPLAAASPHLRSAPVLPRVAPVGGPGGRGSTPALYDDDDTVQMPRVHPKGVEDCRRLRPPTGTPLQSSEVISTGSALVAAGGVEEEESHLMCRENSDGANSSHTGTAAAPPPTLPARGWGVWSGAEMEACSGATPSTAVSWTALGGGGDGAAKMRAGLARSRTAPSSVHCAAEPVVLARPMRGVWVSAGLRALAAVSQLLVLVTWRRSDEALVYAGAVGVHEAALALLLARARRGDVAANRWRRALEEWRWRALCGTRHGGCTVEGSVRTLSDGPTESAGVSHDASTTSERELLPGSQSRPWEVEWAAAEELPPAVELRVTAPLSVQRPVLGVSEAPESLFRVLVRHAAATLLRGICATVLALVMAAACLPPPFSMPSSLLSMVATVDSGAVYLLYWAVNILRGVLDERYFADLSATQSS